MAIERRCASKALLARRKAAFWGILIQERFMALRGHVYKETQSVIYRDLRQAVTGNRDRILPGVGEEITGNWGSRYRDLRLDLPGIEAGKRP
jgi:hypothetical protein